MTSVNASRVVALGALCVLTALVASCHDSPVDPFTKIVKPPERLAPRGAAADVNDSPSGGSASLTISGTDPVPSQQQELGYFPYPTVVSFTASQSVTVTPFDGPSGTMGLGGRGYGNGGCSHQGEAYLLEYPVEGGYGFPFLGCSLPDISATSYSGIVMVSGAVFYGWTGDSSCPPEYGYSCANYGGQSSGTISRLPASIEVTMDESSASPGAAPAGHEFTFRVRVTPDHLGSYATPFQYDGAGWTFTSDAGETTNLDCLWTSEMGTCVMGFWESGTINVKAIVNGVHMSGGSFHVTVVPSTIDLSLSATSVFVGDTVQVRTSITGENPVVERYRVRTLTPPDPDDGGGATIAPLTRPPLTLLRATVSGASALDDPDPAEDPDPTPPPTGGTGGLPSCDDWPAPMACYIVLTEPGEATVTVYGTANRQSLSASKKLTVDAGLRITCTPSVKRANPITCTAKGPAKITGWEFHGELPNGEDYDQTRGAGKHTRQWKGPLVIGGFVTVRGLMNDVEVHAMARVDVKQRKGPEWAPSRMDMGATPPEPQFVKETHSGPKRKLEALYPGFVPQMPGWRPNTNFRLGAPTGGGLGVNASSKITSPAADYVSDGPNRGLAYYTEGLRFPPVAPIYITHAVVPTDPFFVAQQGGTSSDGHRYCDQTDMHALRTNLLQHEKGHYTVARRYGLRPEVQERVEQVVDLIELDKNGEPAVIKGRKGDALTAFQLAYLQVIYFDPIDAAARDDVDFATDDRGKNYQVVYPTCYLRFP